MDKSLIQQYMELSGTKNSLEKFSDMMIESLGESIPEDFREMMREGISTIAERAHPILEQFYTEEEIKGLIAFYESPVGKSLIEKGPLVNQVMFKLGADIGKEISDKYLASL